LVGSETIEPERRGVISFRSRSWCIRMAANTGDGLVQYGNATDTDTSHYGYGVVQVAYCQHCYTSCCMHDAARLGARIAQLSYYMRSADPANADVPMRAQEARSLEKRGEGGKGGTHRHRRFLYFRHGKRRKESAVSCHKRRCHQGKSRSFLEASPHYRRTL
jgi:hypothetical protein